jgi:hypothetical protein
VTSDKQNGGFKPPLHVMQRGRQEGSEVTARQSLALPNFVISVALRARGLRLVEDRRSAGLRQEPLRAMRAWARREA